MQRSKRGELSAALEDALRESDDRFRALVTNSPDVIARFDRQGRHLYVNPTISHYVELTPQDYIGKTTRDLGFSRQLVDRWESAIQLVFETGEPQEFQVEFEGRRGRTVFDCRMAPERDAGGQVRAVVSAARDITARKQAEEALQESEEQYRRLVEGSPDIAYIYSDQRGALYWSARVEEVLGFSRDELMERPSLWHDAIHPDDLPQVDAAIASWQIGKHAELEYRIRDTDGAWHWFQDRFIDKRRVGDEVLIEGLATDITDRKEAEQRLRQYAEEQAALYAIAAETSAHLTPPALLPAVLDQVIPLLEADAGWVTLLGPTLDDPPHVVASRGVTEAFVRAENSEPLRDCPVCSAILTSETPELEWALVSECPRVPQSVLGDLELHCHITVPLTASNRVLGFVHIGWRLPPTDEAINGRLLTAVGRQIGLALQNAQLYEEARQVDRLRAINDIATALISSTDQRVVLRQVLEPTCQALNAVEGAIILIDPTTGQPYLAMALTDRGKAHQGTRLPPGRGIAGWVVHHGKPVLVNDVERDPRFCLEVDGVLGLAISSLICAPMRHVQARTMGAITVLNRRGGRFREEDLSLLESVASTSAVALENARLYQDLKQAIREQEETQAKLVHAAKMSALGRLAASTAHEINNPLQAVQGYLSLAAERLQAAESEERVQRYLRVACSEVERISHILARMRDFYRPTRQGFWPTDVHAVLERVLDLSRKRLEEGNVAVACRWSPGTPAALPRVEANADQLSQVFLNLVINAIEAMPDGGVLSVSTALERPTEDSRPAVRIEFADTGIGMGPVALDRVFEPFFTTKEDGAGLGLSVSYGIIQSHRGEIWVTSEEGRGATFTIRLLVEQPRAM